LEVRRRPWRTRRGLCFAITYAPLIDDLTTKKIVLFCLAALAITILIAAVPITAEALLH
jgi:hypothetical protein